MALAAFNFGQTGRIDMDLQQLVCFGERSLQNSPKTGHFPQEKEAMSLAQDQMAQILEAAIVQGSGTDSALRNPQTSSVVRLHHSFEMEKRINPSDYKSVESSIFSPPEDRKLSTGCSGACRCTCHKKRRLSTPNSTRDWPGDLTVTFSGTRPVTSAYALASCACNLGPLISVDFRLPSRLAVKMISTWLKAAPIQGPDLLLRSRRIIETPSYYTAEQGNLQALRQM